MRLLPRPVFPGLGENADEAKGHCSATVGFRIIANHRHLPGSALKSFDGEREECPRRLSEYRCLSAASVFQRRNKRTPCALRLTTQTELRTQMETATLLMLGTA